MFLSWLFTGLYAGTSLSTATSLESLSIPAELLVNKPGKLNPEFVISVESVLKKLREKEEITLIDVRTKAAYAKFRIPGSINIPLFALRTKTFLRTKPLVLINEGYCYGRLEKECIRLRDEGFTCVSVMFGGLAHWRLKGGPIEGDVFSIKDLNMVSAGDFFGEKGYQNQVVVNVSENMGPETAYLLPRTISVPYRDREKGFVSDFKKKLPRQGVGPLMTVLIYNQDGDYPERMGDLILEAGIINFYFLQGGLDGYEKFLRQQADMWRTKNRKKLVKECASCP